MFANTRIPMKKVIKDIDLVFHKDYVIKDVLSFCLEKHPMYSVIYLEFEV